jgi:hypothetical protein
MSYISVRGEQSTSSEITALTNLASLATSGAGQFVRKTGATTFENATPTDTGIIGSTGSTDNAVLRADGTGGGTLQSTGLIVDDSNVFFPSTSDAGTLGSTTKMWSDLFLASGAVVNFNNGDVLITHSTNTLTFTGAASGYLYDAMNAPSSNDAAALGSTTLMWSDLFLASGAVINFNNGDVTITHSSDLLTIGGGNVIISSPGTAAGSVATIDGTQTLTNKRTTPRITSITSSATPTINTDNCDAVTITALAAAITSFTTNLSGTPNNFDKLTIRIKDDGTARAITWGASFEAKGVALPTTTVISKVLTVGFIYDTVTSKWGCVSSAQEV